MSLDVISGYREYLLPHPLERDGLTAALRTLEPTGTVPLVRWTADPIWYHGFIYDDADAAEVERTVTIFLEYVADTVGPGETAQVILPFEWWDDPSARGGTLAHPRVRHFVGLAEARFGAGAVRCRRLYFSDNTQRVLDQLREAAGEPAIAPAPPGRGPIERIKLEGLLTGAALEAARRNYSYSVLRLCERIVGRRSVFASDRAEQVAELLERNQMMIRPDLGPERILAELESGGELFALLTRPVPPAQPVPVFAAPLAPDGS